eukprot:PhM_4_TR11697/c4_g1_i2/m.23626
MSRREKELEAEVVRMKEEMRRLRAQQQQQQQQQPRAPPPMMTAQPPPTDKEAPSATPPAAVPMLTTASKRAPAMPKHPSAGAPPPTSRSDEALNRKLDTILLALREQKTKSSSPAASHTPPPSQVDLRPVVEELRALRQEVTKVSKTCVLQERRIHELSIELSAMKRASVSVSASATLPRNSGTSTPTESVRSASPIEAIETPQPKPKPTAKRTPRAKKASSVESSASVTPSSAVVPESAGGVALATATTATTPTATTTTTAPVKRGRQSSASSRQPKNRKFEEEIAAARGRTSSAAALQQQSAAPANAPAVSGKMSPFTLSPDLSDMEVLLLIPEMKDGVQLNQVCAELDARTRGSTLHIAALLAQHVQGKCSALPNDVAVQGAVKSIFLPLRPRHPSLVDDFYTTCAPVLLDESLLQTLTSDQRRALCLALTAVCQVADRMGLCRLLSARVIMAYARTSPAIAMELLKLLCRCGHVWGAPDYECPTRGLLYGAVHMALTSGVVPASADLSELLLHCGWPSKPTYTFDDMLMMAVSRVAANPTSDGEAMISVELLLRCLDVNSALMFIHNHVLDLDACPTLLLSVVVGFGLGEKVQLVPTHPLLQKCQEVIKSTNVSDVRRVHAAVALALCCGDGLDTGRVLAPAIEFARSYFSSNNNTNNNSIATEVSKTTLAIFQALSQK